MDKINKQQLLEKAKETNGKTIREIIGDVKIDRKDKGNIGNIIQQYYFDIDINNRPEPDFLENYGLPIELKVTPLKKNKNGEYSAKERLVFGMIDFNNFPKNFEESSFYYKDSDNLIMNYYHDPSLKSKIDYKFVNSWYLTLKDLPKSEYEQIKRDYEEIYNYILEGRAHEISGRYTEILEACRKGQGKGRDWTSQPNSDVKAPRRAFAFKQSYLNKLILRSMNGSQESFSDSMNKLAFDMYEIYTNYKGVNFAAGEEESKAKNWNFALQKKKVGPRLTDEMKLAIDDDFIKVRTMTLNDKGLAKESLVLSTGHIIPSEILSPVKFEDSKFFAELNKPYILLLFDRKHVLKNVLFFKNFLYPEELYKNAEKIWLDTRNQFKKISFNDEYIKFIKMKDDEYFHIRPKARDGKKKYENTNITLQAFWLNRKYINEIIKKEKE